MRTKITATALIVALAVNACGGGEVEARECGPEAGDGRLELPWGAAHLDGEYEAVETGGGWVVAGGPGDILYIVAADDRNPEEVIRELGDEGASLFVEVCAPDGRGWLSTPIDVGQAQTRTVVGVIEKAGGVLVVAGSRPDGGREGVRGAVEEFISGFELAPDEVPLASR